MIIPNIANEDEYEDNTDWNWYKRYEELGTELVIFDAAKRMRSPGSQVMIVGRKGYAWSFSWPGTSNPLFSFAPLGQNFALYTKLTMADACLYCVGDKE